jgi:hypothetical protein
MQALAAPNEIVLSENRTSKYVEKTEEVLHRKKRNFGEKVTEALSFNGWFDNRRLYGVSIPDGFIVHSSEGKQSITSAVEATSYVYEDKLRPQYSAYRQKIAEWERVAAIHEVGFSPDMTFEIVIPGILGEEDERIRHFEELYPYSRIHRTFYYDTIRKIASDIYHSAVHGNR